MSYEFDAYHEYYGRSMHICPGCDSGLVQPRRWERECRDQWRVWLRCPECEWEDDDVYSSQEIEEYDEILDLGTIAINEMLKESIKVNMEEAVGAFTVALENDAILPEDF